MALVTGTNRGIGRAIAEAMAAGGDCRVLAAARLQEDADATAAELGRDVVGVALDLGDPQTAARQVREIEQAHGPIDILINNAGVLVEGNATDVPLGDAIHSLAVNALSPLALIQALGPGMKGRGWGRIVNLSSGWGSFDERLTGPAAYSISKAALNAVTVTSAQALGPAVKVNACCPGWVRTRMGGESANRSVEEGADTPVWLATLPDDGPTGGFYRNRRPIRW
ncbi:MAG: SDR family NAD(P)-dependent oxidoreductase [Pseudomonadota bacterium]